MIELVMASMPHTPNFHLKLLIVKDALAAYGAFISFSKPHLLVRGQILFYHNILLIHD